MYLMAKSKKSILCGFEPKLKLPTHTPNQKFGTRLCYCYQQNILKSLSLVFLVLRSKTFQDHQKKILRSTSMIHKTCSDKTIR